MAVEWSIMTAEKTDELLELDYQDLEGVELTAGEIQHALHRAAIIKKAVSKYLELVKEIPEVVEVRLCRDYAILWTILSESERLPETIQRGDGWMRVVDAELQIMRSMERPLLDFRRDNCHGYELGQDFYNRFHIGGERVWEK